MAKQNNPNLDSPFSAIKALAGCQTPFLDGVLKFSIGGLIALERAGCEFGKEQNFVSLITWAYAFYEKDSQSRASELFLEACEGKDKFQARALAWSAEVGLDASNIDLLMDAFNEFAKSAESAKTEYRPESVKGAKSKNA